MTLADFSTYLMVEEGTYVKELLPYVSPVAGMVPGLKLVLARTRGTLERYSLRFNPGPPGFFLVFFPPFPTQYP